jgi:hypothetical protein
MKKTILAVVAIVLLLGMNIAFARTQILPLAVQEPVDFVTQQIWAAINTLQDQVNTDGSRSLQNTQRITTLEQQITELNNKLSCLTKVGDDLYFDGCNVNIRNGAGSSGSTNGLGNLIIGYNELGDGTEDRSGSHNLVIGRRHSYSGYIGLVMGEKNTIGSIDSVTGGSGNIAVGGFSSVSGGANNTAEGSWSSVSGGTGNWANGWGSFMAGGGNNNASGLNSTIVGGVVNIASGSNSTVLGGSQNIVTGSQGVVSGGYFNTASGLLSSVSGGHGNNALGDYSSVSGGLNRIASSTNNWVAGGLYEAN